MQFQSDKNSTHQKKIPIAAASPQVQAKKQVLSLVDNRPETATQRKMQESFDNRTDVHQLQSSKKTTVSPATQENQVIQLAGGWTKAKAERFKKWLRRRAARRWAKRKRKTSAKLVRKYVRARMMANKGWKPSMADSNKSGHHVPPLALANKHKGAFVFGPRGKAKEKKRRRLYFKGKKKTRKEAHWMAHEAEAMQGINRMTKFKGTDKELAKKMLLAHQGLTTMDGNDIEVEDRSQNSKSTGNLFDIGDATKSIMESRIGSFNMKFDKDRDTSSPESDFEKLGSDSDVFNSYSSSSSSSSSGSSSESSSGSSSSSSSDESEMETDTDSGNTTTYSSSSGSSSSSSEDVTDTDVDMTSSSSSSESD